MSLLINILLFSVGLLAIIKGADWLTDGAASIAERFGIPTLVVGLTIVAIGSSAPEFVVSVLSAIQGNADIALGNIVGSNIFNILGIMGVTALVRPVIVQRSNVLYDVPFAVLSSVAIAATVLLPDSCGTRQLGRGEGGLVVGNENLAQATMLLLDVALILADCHQQLLTIVGSQRVNTSLVLQET